MAVGPAPAAGVETAEEFLKVVGDLLDEQPPPEAVVETVEASEGDDGRRPVVEVPLPPPTVPIILFHLVQPASFEIVETPAENKGGPPIQVNPPEATERSGVQMEPIVALSLTLKPNQVEETPAAEVESDAQDPVLDIAKQQGDVPECTEQPSRLRCEDHPDAVDGRRVDSKREATTTVRESTTTVFKLNARIERTEVQVEVDAPTPAVHPLEARMEEGTQTQVANVHRRRSDDADGAVEQVEIRRGIPRTVGARRADSERVEGIDRGSKSSDEAVAEPAAGFERRSGWQPATSRVPEQAARRGAEAGEQLSREWPGSQSQGTSVSSTAQPESRILGTEGGERVQRPAAANDELPGMPTRPDLRTTERGDRPPERPAPVRQLEIRLSEGEGPAVKLNFVERSGRVHIDVRTGDAKLAESMRLNVGDLTARLASHGDEILSCTPAEGPAPVANAEGGNASFERGPGEGPPASRDGSASRDQQQRRAANAWAEYFDKTLNDSAVFERRH